MRKILHIDQNAFFASVEQALKPELKNKPIAVAGDSEKRSGIILTASYEARAYGVKTAMTIGDAKKLCPNLILVKPNYKMYSKFSRDALDIIKAYSPLIEQFSIDECWVDVTGCEKLFGRAEDIGFKIKEKIKEQLDITCSVGVSYCKLMAKMASDIKKPDGLTVVMQEDIPIKIWPLLVKDLLMVGPKTAQKLNKVGIYTIGDLAKTPIEFLRAVLGKGGVNLWNFANGIDKSTVKEFGSHYLIKGVGNSTTTSKDLVTTKEVEGYILSLSECVSKRLRDNGLRGDSLEITIKNSDFQTITRHKKLKKFTYITEDIYMNAMELFKENWDWKSSIRLLGVRLTSLVPIEEGEQISLFDDIRDQKFKDLSRSMDYIRDKYGYTSIKRAALMVNETPQIYHTSAPVRSFQPK